MEPNKQVPTSENSRVKKMLFLKVVFCLIENVNPYFAKAEVLETNIKNFLVFQFTVIACVYLENMFHILCHFFDFLNL